MSRIVEALAMGTMDSFGRVIFSVGLWLVCQGLLGSGVYANQECEEKADIVFLVDSSLSVREENPYDGSYDNWEHMKYFMIGVIDQLPIDSGDIRIGVVKFSNAVDENEVIYFSPAPNSVQLKKRVKNLTFMGGNTNTSGAFRKMTQSLLTAAKGDREDFRNLCVLITDGLSNIDANLTLPEARFAKVNHKVRMFTVAITKYANTAELQEISTDPVSYHSLLSETFTQLPLLVDQMLSKLCKSKAPATCTTARADIVFLLDSSGSIRDTNPDEETDNWSILKEFVAAVINSLDVDSNQTRVSVIRFTSSAYLDFNLDRFHDSASMTKAVLALEYKGSETNISGALRMMRTQVFGQDEGDRPDVKNIGIIITDGQSNIEKDQTAIEARAAKTDNIRMFAIGMTNKISETELRTIASEPTNDHYFNTTTIGNVDKLLERLVYSICQTETPECSTGDNCTLNDRPRADAACEKGTTLEWRAYPDHLFVGHNYDRVQNVDSAEECQRLCLKNAQCRSVDYLVQGRECAVSYQTKDVAPESFVQQSGVDYYEFECTKG